MGRLSQSLPGLISFTTSGRDFYPNDNLDKLVASILTHFKKIVEININRDGMFGHCRRRDWNMLRNRIERIANIVKNTPNRRNCSDQ